MSKKPAAKKPVAKKPAEKKPETAQEPSESEETPVSTDDTDDIFSSDFDENSAEAPAPAAKPAAKPAPQKAKKPVVNNWDVMVVQVTKKTSLEEFAKFNSRSVASILALNPNLSADQEIAEGTAVKIFIDPDRQQ